MKLSVWLDIDRSGNFRQKSQRYIWGVRVPCIYINKKSPYPLPPPPESNGQGILCLVFSHRLIPSINPFSLSFSGFAYALTNSSTARAGRQVEVSSNDHRLGGRYAPSVVSTRGRA